MRTDTQDPRILRGMEAQLKLREARLQAGQKSLGWKVGFGTPPAMERLGITAPLVGFLTDSVRLPPGATVSVAGWTRPAVEPEVAVIMGQDLGAGADRATVQAAIAALSPAFEVADIAFQADDVVKVLSGNIFNRNVMLGQADATRAGANMDGVVGRVSRNGQEVAVVTDSQAATGNLVDIVQHVAETLAASGARLRAGEIIITGSIIPPLWIEGPEEIGYALEPIGGLSLKLTTGE